MTNAVVPPKAQVSSIVKTILQKTLQNQANWTILDKTDQSCQLILDRTRIKLEFESPTVEPDRVMLTIYPNQQEKSCEIVFVVVQEGEPEWDMYFKLYSAACNVAYKWNELLNDLSADVNKSGSIGHQV